MSESTPTGDQDGNASGGVKDAFREALERKKGKRHPHESASQNDSKVHDTHGAAGGKRVHRRKSG